MRLRFLVLLSFLAVSFCSFGQSSDTGRVANRQKLKSILDKYGAGVHINFRLSDKQPFNFTGNLSTGLTNCEFLETVVTVSPDATISFRIYPYYKGNYININSSKNSSGLMKKLLELNGTNFMYWGADNTGDIFAGFMITLESGMPEQVIDVVLNSIKPLDQYVGEMQPFVGR